MRLIDGDELIYYLEKHKTYELAAGRNSAYGKGIRDAIKFIGSVRTIDAAPVVHAHWIGIEYNGYADGNPVYDRWACSACDDEIDCEADQLTKYCSFCGAIMDEKVVEMR